MNIALHWFAYRGLVVKQVRRFLRAWVQNLLPSVVTATLFLVVFGHLVGRELGGMGGVAYADFILPGLVMLAVITNAYSNVTLAVYGARLQRHIEEILVAPMPAWLVVAGFATGGLLRGLLAGALVLAIALPFTDLALHHIGATAGIAVLTALLFSLAGLINGVFARSFDHTSVVNTFVLTPLIYLGGLFYPVSRLPEPWDTVAAANPMHYIIEGFRHGLLGASPVAWTTTFAVLAAATVVVGWLAWYLVARGVRIKA
ncbi:ABC-2 type transport system permease protein [Thiohalospira halophila DSM 15071]|uniref:Transport permease protein n=1 Tax=Thiohalospira halophila DSM 15071 TaxID=1123397 RepID=A0A1I1QG47_9GAMM|nr:ABC transporter permease [Thiohalospira halophila]SFD17090.1 ABC-2 type transport system permease protein [Thiohalospira halophila DSM 15071]